MENNNNIQIDKDLKNNKITVTRFFDSELPLVWLSWTNSEILDQWWAPRPYFAETKSYEFRDGGLWLYAMVGPDNQRQWCRANFSNIATEKSFEWIDAFCDENGIQNPEFPQSKWRIEFVSVAKGTNVIVTLQSTSEGGLKRLLDLGFQEGFTMGLNNLEQVLKGLKLVRK